MVKVVTAKTLVNINSRHDLGSGPQACLRERHPGSEHLPQDSPDNYTEMPTIPTNGGRPPYYFPTSTILRYSPKTDVDHWLDFGVPE